MMSRLLKKIKTGAVLNAKNLIGWKTKRKLVIFSVDDYGNVRLHSKEVRDNLYEAGLKMNNRFDKFDSLETRDDLEALFEVLTSVKDRHDRHAVFTPYAVPCNIDFEKMSEEGYREYHYELLPETFRKLSEQQPDAYIGALELLKEGISKRLMVPQFHGREHLNLRVLQEKLAADDHDVLTALKNRSYTGIGSSGYNTISAMAAFDFWEFEENKQFHSIIEDGLNHFENVFGYRARNFTPPVYNAHSILYKTLQKSGIRFIDTAMFAKEHQGRGKYKRSFNYTGKIAGDHLHFMIRNVVFEPSDKRGVDWVSYALKHIEAAFRWNRPAIISSHRVNFCGHIEEENRKEGLKLLKELLKKITERWPEVEFMAANELGDLIYSDMEHT